MHFGSAHCAGVLWQRRIHSILRLKSRLWSRQGKSSTVTPWNGAARQNSPLPKSVAELGRAAGLDARTLGGRSLFVPGKEDDRPR